MFGMHLNSGSRTVAQGSSKRRKLEHKTQRAVCFADIPSGPLCVIAQFLSVLGHIEWARVCKKVRAATHQNRLAWGTDYEMDNDALVDFNHNAKFLLHPAIVWAMGCRQLRAVNLHQFNNDLSGTWLTQFGAQLTHLAVAQPWNVPRSKLLPLLRSLVVACSTSSGFVVEAVKRSMPNLEHVELSTTWSELTADDICFPKSIKSAKITLCGQDDDTEAPLQLPEMPGVTRLELDVRAADIEGDVTLINTENFPALTDLTCTGTVGDSGVYLLTESAAMRIVKLRISLTSWNPGYGFDLLVEDHENCWNALETLETNVVPSKHVKMPKIQTVVINTLVQDITALPLWRRIKRRVKYFADLKRSLKQGTKKSPAMFIPRVLGSNCCTDASQRHADRCFCPKCSLCHLGVESCKCEVAVRGW